MPFSSPRIFRCDLPPDSPTFFPVQLWNSIRRSLQSLEQTGSASTKRNQRSLASCFKNTATGWRPKRRRGASEVLCAWAFYLVVGVFLFPLYFFPFQSPFYFRWGSIYLGSQADLQGPGKSYDITGHMSDKHENHKILKCAWIC